MTGRLRIIAGTRKGHRLHVPPGRNVRPTGDRVREALFSALGDLEGDRVLDLFAGSGALGMEALSRGAAYCTFVESDRGVLAALKRNIRSLDFESRSDVWPVDYTSALRRAEDQDHSWDLLFIDPPYKMLRAVMAVLARFGPRVLSPSGLMVVEGPRDVDVAAELRSSELALEPVFERRYGDTVVTMVERG